MKIIYLHQYFKFPDENGGTRSYDLTKSFIENNIEVVVVSSTSDDKFKDEKGWKIITREGIEVHYIYIPYGNNLSYLNRIKGFVKFMFSSSKRLLSIKADMVLATSTPLTIGIPALMKKMFNKTPFVFEARDVWPEAVIAIGAINNKFAQNILFYLERIIYKHAKAIVPLSSDMATSIVSRYPEISENTTIDVIENISEIDRFSEISNKNILLNEIGFKPRCTILYAGTFGKVNGIDYVIDLAKKTAELDPGIVYILIGSGALKDEVIQKAKEDKVYHKNVFILDSVNKEELPNWYHSTDIGSSFVIPIEELWANSANKFFDTLAAAKPILINHEGWQAEVIRKYNIGFVLPEIIDEKSALEFVLYTQNSALLRMQGSNARKVAEEKYSLEIASEKYLNIFQEVLA